MSYMRCGWPLERFKGKTQSYVFGTCDKTTEDYGDEYENNPSFVELITCIVERQTDKDYAAKICRTLAKKLGCEKLLLNNGYRTDEKSVMKKTHKKLTEGNAFCVDCNEELLCEDEEDKNHSLRCSECWAKQEETMSLEEGGE